MRMRTTRIMTAMVLGVLLTVLLGFHPALASEPEVSPTPEIVWITLGEEPGKVNVHWISSDLQPPRSVVTYDYEFLDPKPTENNWLTPGPKLSAVGERIELGQIGERRYWVHHVPMQLNIRARTVFTVPTSSKTWRVMSFRDHDFGKPEDGSSGYSTFLRDERVAVASDLSRDSKPLEQAVQTLTSKGPDLVVLSGNVTGHRGQTDEKALHAWLNLLQILSDHLPVLDRILPAIAVMPGYFDIDLKQERSAERTGLMHKLFPSIQRLPYAIEVSSDLRLLLLDAGYTKAVAEQTAWLEEQLLYTDFHGFTVPIYAESAYPAAKKFHSLGSREIRRHWTPIFDMANVPVIIEAYDRTYKQTQPIIDETPTIGGTVYLGGGGFARNRQDKPAQPGFGGWMSSMRHYLAKSQATGHFVMLNASNVVMIDDLSTWNHLTEVPDRLQVEVITNDGQVIDDITFVENQPNVITTTFYAKPHQRGEILILLGIALIVTLFWLGYRNKQRRQLADSTA